MKTSILFVALIYCLSSNAQNNPACLSQFKKIASFIINNRKSELANLVVYPIKRSNPLPDIKSKTEFINLFPSLFDKPFKNQLQKITEDDLIDRYDGCRLFAGDIWINEEGRIIAINYQSASEKQRYNSILNDVKKRIHP